MDAALGVDAMAFDRRDTWGQPTGESSDSLL
jgi:hypothetical protein